MSCNCRVSPSRAGICPTYSGELADQATARQAHELMMSHVLNGRLVVETSTVPLSGIADAWKRQAGGPGTKLVIVP